MFIHRPVMSLLYTLYAGDAIRTKEPPSNSNSMFPTKPSHKRYMPAETVMAQIPPMITSGIILNIYLILVIVPNTHHRIPNHATTNWASFCSTKKPTPEYSSGEEIKTAKRPYSKNSAPNIGMIAKVWISWKMLFKVNWVQLLWKVFVIYNIPATSRPIFLG